MASVTTIITVKDCRQAMFNYRQNLKKAQLKTFIADDGHTFVLYETSPMTCRHIALARPHKDAIEMLNITAELVAPLEQIIRKHWPPGVKERGQLHYTLLVCTVMYRYVQYSVPFPLTTDLTEGQRASKSRLGYDVHYF